MATVMTQESKTKLENFLREELCESGVEVSDLMVDYLVDSIEASFNALVSLHPHLMGS